MLLIFFLGIQENELNLFLEQIREIDDQADQVVVPIISGRIEAINNKNPKELFNKNNKSFGLLTEKEEFPGLRILQLTIQL